eukprot:gnl/TRDRNA2_/TRDRNA2_65751_c0_seq1.p1 gnl/TRDRNA2_/TRDRNA2_65751_c0~~gnl/TRDRNA2_/TRDRNA2_65751_c0_seq1.p1  ORF type:complete len:356 (-),score=63.14 gnl/TRDRNA2_/TRDRNA2_65751_c0_seq1:57-1124(-)
MSGQLWEVVGGSEKGGVLVRADKGTTSPELPERLSTGSIVKEIAIEGDRLRYERVTGAGPDTGWISVKFKGKDLVVKKVLSDLVSLHPPPDCWRLLYFKAPHRGEQLRLLFHLTGTPFDDPHLDPYPESLRLYTSNIAGDDSPLAFDQAPVLQHGDFSVAQSVAAMQYLGEFLGLVEDSRKARAEALMLVAGTEDMRNAVFYPAFSGFMGAIEQATSEKVPPEKISTTKAWLEIVMYMNGPYKTWHKHFERYLRCRQKEDGGPWLMGKKLTYPDIALFDCATAIWSLPGCQSKAVRTKTYPLLCAHADAVRNLPKLKEYLDGRGSVWNVDMLDSCGEEMVKGLPPSLKSAQDGPW